MSLATKITGAVLFGVGLIFTASTAQARFLQTDPIGYEDQMNLYNYCGNNPLNCTDPTGTRTKYHGTTADSAAENRYWLNSLTKGGIKTPPQQVMMLGPVLKGLKFVLFQNLIITKVC